jgi:polysaccharide chain length determinant protein (PEP-CTERM system associated)
VLPGKTFTPQEIASILIRRRWVILLPFAVGLAVAPLIAKRVPEVYRSETLIMVVPQRVPDSYVKSTVTATVEDRLPSISDQILSRSRLERIINDFDLYREYRATAPMEDIVRLMRADVGSPQIQRGEQSFRISYVSEDPRVAQKVAARLASLFIDENTNERESLAASTNDFLEAQLEEARKKLLESERKLEIYRRAHSGELPSQLEGNLQAIQTAQLQLQSVSDSLNHARERRLLVERQLVDAKTTPVVVAPITGGQSDATANLSTAQRLEIAKSTLANLRLRYKPDWPDVRTMERTVRELEQKLREEASRPAEPNPNKVITLEEQAQQKKIRELQADLEVLDHQLERSEQEATRLRASIADYRRKVDAVPSRESELVELTRDYDILKKTYDELLTKRANSQLAVDLERRQIGEQFRILDPASLPERPSNEVKRVAYIFGGAIVGLGLGFLLVGLMELTDSTFNREEEIARLLTLPVLALVPVMSSEREKSRRKIRRVLLDVAGSALLVASFAIVVVWGLKEL